jgi:hypothetical protein
LVKSKKYEAPQCTILFYVPLPPLC